MKDDLNKNFDDFRKKELFDFRPFYTAKLRIVRDPKAFDFEKVPAAKPSDQETWKVTPAGAPGFTADATAMDDLLNKLPSVKAESFIDPKSTKTGLDKPALVVSASYDEGKFERVRFGQVGDSYYAVRDGESGAVKVDASSLKNVLQALDLAVTPKAPTPAPTNTTPATVGAKK